MSVVKLIHTPEGELKVDNPLLIPGTEVLWRSTIKSEFQHTGFITESTIKSTKRLKEIANGKYSDNIYVAKTLNGIAWVHVHKDNIKVVGGPNGNN